MDRGERLGLGAAALVHGALFAALSLTWAAAPAPEVTPQRPIEVSLVQAVALAQTSPAPTPPAPSVAPDKGEPEDAAPPVPAPTVAKPKPPKPAPEPVEAKPLPIPKPAAAKPVPAPVPKLAKPKPEMKTTPPKAAPKPKPTAEPTNDSPAKPPRAKTRSSLDRLLDDLPATDAAAKRGIKGNGTSAATTAAKAKGARLGPDILKGLSDTPTKAPRADAAPGAMSTQARADIASAILRQVQPCANRQVNPGPGAERIRVAIALDLNPDGSLAAAPRVVNHDGVDEENRRYLDRVDDLAVATFTGCSPLKGLPANLYDVPGGWHHFTLRYKLPG